MIQNNCISFIPTIVLDKTFAFSLIAMKENISSPCEKFCVKKEPLEELKRIKIIDASNAMSTPAAADSQVSINCKAW